MESIYRKFYLDFYMRTGGFIPTWPLNQSVYPGDFFQIRNGQMVILGNIYRHGLVPNDYARFAIDKKLSPSWNISDGVTKPYSGRGIGHGAIEGQFEYSKQVLAFARKGSFFFKADHPESIRIDNWKDIQEQLIIKFTQTVYSFRQLYLVMESATVDNATLAIAGAPEGELEIASDTENFGLVDIFGHHSSKTIQSKEIEYFDRQDKRKPSYFKAKKLVVQDEKTDVFVSTLLNREKYPENWADNLFGYEFYNDDHHYVVQHNIRGSLLDMLQVNELNPNTALQYFKWADASIDDIERLFQRYEN